MKLIIVRHGETDWNLINKLQSFTDVPLNDIGKKQVEKTGEYLKKQKFDLILSSPLKRTIETAKIINKYHDADIILDELIIERNFGKLEGSNYFELEKKMKEIRGEDLYELMEIEKSENVKKRVKMFLDKYNIDRHYGKTILMVSHSSYIKIFLSVICQIPLQELRKKIIKKNASITIIDFNRDFSIKDIKIGIDEHL
ncbi:MAG: histidine phosphatase family protein [Nanoarchaeota archaeon]|nr:histidine phosphatase family protein [Nanoarchaeota archaeon]